LSLARSPRGKAARNSYRELLGAVFAIGVVLFAAPTAASAQGQTNLADTIAGRSDLSTFSRGLEAAGLTATLSGAGPYTVWAPTNGAFDKLPAGQLNALLQDPPALRRILLYHIGQGPITAAQIVQVPTVRTLEGEPIKVSASGSNVELNDATVTQPDVLASNGIIHVIDSVLLPPSDMGALPVTGEANSSVALGLALAAAVLVAAGVVLRLAGPARPTAARASEERQLLDR
jgi:uncharacterized surface protein with fasciclin (FAS1) repeats